MVSRSPFSDDGTLEASLLEALRHPRGSPGGRPGEASCLMAVVSSILQVSGADQAVVLDAANGSETVLARVGGGALPLLETPGQAQAATTRSPDGELTPWVRVGPVQGATLARLSIDTAPLLEGCLVLQWHGRAPGFSALEALPDPLRVRRLVAIAAGVDSLGKGRSTGGLLIGPLAGEPARASLREVFELFPGIIGRSAALAGVLQSVLLASRSDIPVLVQGESGTGKELIARALHDVSRRKEQPFVCENCGAIPEGLVESELFGHEKGAFTGADRARPGIFERGHGGTVFLDEVGEMELGLQRKLLRVLEMREVRRVGAGSGTSVDFRLVSATNRVLEDMVERGTFRQDLYYRLQVVTIHLPPLRERPEDIPLLVDHFCRRFAAEARRDPVELTPAAVQVLARYPWPGNIRELRNEIWRAACSERPRVGPEHLSPHLTSHGRAPAGPLLASAGRPEGAVVSSRPGEPLPPLLEIERGALASAIFTALRESGGNVSEAARRLRVARTTLYRRLRRLGLVVARGPSGKASTSD